MQLRITSDDTIPKKSQNKNPTEMIINLTNETIPMDIQRVMINNPYLTILDFSYSRPSLQQMKLISETIPIIKNLTRLDFCRMELDHSAIEILCTGIQSHINLISIDLTHNRIGELGAKSIGHLLQHLTIQELKLGSNHIGAKGIHYISKGLIENTNLIELELSSNAIGDQGAMSIASALTLNKTLRKIHLNNNAIKSQGIMHMHESLKSNLNITELQIFGNRFDSTNLIDIYQLLVRNITREKQIQSDYITLLSISRSLVLLSQLPIDIRMLILEYFKGVLTGNEFNSLYPIVLDRFLIGHLMMCGNQNLMYNCRILQSRNKS
ncbi:hypothetical protein BC833DRAFT_596877 [Globomyces pollinis-pini]|nr:hypothetical protein BC833DRAFT_596877 [Globomyces pollinis-pini]